MKYYLHSTGLFLTSVAMMLVAIFAAGWIIVRAAGIESDFVLFLILLPVFFMSFLGSMRLYAKHLRLSCPDCGKKLKMHYGPSAPVFYHCNECDYSYHTRLTIGKQDWS